MNKLVAKPIVTDQFWIVTDGVKKIGNIYLNNHNVYEVNLSGNRSVFFNKDELSRTIKIDFQSYTKKKTVKQPYPEYPTPKQIYNSIMDVKRGLHLFTKTKKSKCYYTAGYFVIDFNGNKEVIFCPKYIFIQRYPYKGPFKTKSDAISSINS
jgi:hypothetical protein